MRQTSQCGLTAKCQLMVWIFEIHQRNVRDRMRMEFGLWSVPKDTMPAIRCGAERNEDRVLTLHECWELTREIDESTSVAIGCSETFLMIGGSATEVELFVTCILVQRHETTSQERVKKYHFCLSIPINSMRAHVVLCFSCRHVVSACLLVEAQSIVQRFDSFLCPC